MSLHRKKSACQIGFCSGLLAGIEEQLAASATNIAETNARIRERQEERRLAWTDAQSRESRLIALDELLSRFRLLRSHYDTDLKRLDFIDEGQHLVDQLETVSCPLCGAALAEHPPIPCDPTNGVTIDSVHSAYAQEAEKIRRHIADLNGTVGVLSVERTEVAAQAATLRQTIGDIDDDLARNLSPRLEMLRDELEALARHRGESLYLQTMGEHLRTLEVERDSIGDAEVGGTETLEGDAQVYIDEAATKDFCGLMRALLVRWHYLPLGSTVEFDANTFDFIVDGQGRADNGKGVRAVIHAAFNIALMQYCLAKNLPHPRFLILDSPLTTYKERDDEPKPDEIDEVKGEVQTAFFEDLAKIQSNEQIIVLENKRPPASIADNSHYIEFVGTKVPGRAGFFPIPKG